VTLARSARVAANAAVGTLVPAAVAVARAAGVRFADVADRAAPVLDRIDDVGLPWAQRALAAAAARLGVAWDGTLDVIERLAVRFGLLRPRPVQAGAGAGAAPAGAAGAGGGASWGSAGRSRRGGVRAVLERGARAVVLGLVAMIVLSAAAAMLPGADGQLKPAGSAGPAGSPEGTVPAGAGGTDPATGTAAAGITVGPYPGDSPEQYAATAGQGLLMQASAAPEADLLAIVSLVDYQTPDELHALLADYRLTQVFFAVPAVGSVYSADVRDPVADVRTAFEREASEASARAAVVTDPTRRAAATTEAGALRGRCACLFAAVVRAPAARLVTLDGSAGVRVVDAAPPGTAASAVTFVPLLPARR
jgi:hypothetical protein